MDAACYYFHFCVNVCQHKRWGILLAFFVFRFVFQPKERGSTRVHALNNVNRVLQVLHQNNVSDI